MTTNRPEKPDLDSDLPPILRDHPLESHALRYEPERVKLTFKEHMFLWSTSPVGPLWLFIAVALVAGVVHSVLSRQIQWEAFSSAGLLAATARGIARMKGIAPWPWSDPNNIDDIDDD